MSEDIVNPLEPFTPAQLQDMKETQGKIRELRAAMKKADKAGIDITSQEEQLEAVSKRLNTMLSVYGNVR